MKSYKVRMTWNVSEWKWHPEEVAPLVEQFILEAHTDYEVPLRDIDQNRNPLLIFTNRTEDGILHTATRTSKKYAGGGPGVRRISHTAIRYTNPRLLGE